MTSVKPVVNDAKGYKNTTTRIMANLALGYLDGVGLDPQSKAVRKVTYIYVKESQILTAVDESAADLVESAQVLKSILGKLKEAGIAGNQASVQSLKIHTESSAPALKGIEENELLRDTVKTSTTQSSETVFANLRAFLKRLRDAKDVDIDVILGDMVNQKILTSAMDVIRTQERDLGGLEKNSNKLEERIDREIKAAYASLQPQEKRAVEPLIKGAGQQASASPQQQSSTS